jgi:hypothetical protein
VMRARSPRAPTLGHRRSVRRNSRPDDRRAAPRLTRAGQS